MKRLILNTLLIVTIPIILMGCTHNNGDIGPLFGNWKLESIRINNEADESYKGNIFFGFQNQIVLLNEVFDDHSYLQCYGTWEMTDKDLILVFKDELFNPQPATHFNKDENICEIIELSSSKMKLKMTHEENTYEYSLTKW